MQDSAIGARLTDVLIKLVSSISQTHYHLSILSFAASFPLGSFLSPLPTGYIRVLMNIVAFALCFSNKIIFSVLYFVSFVCDGIDGWCARKFNQVSTFGAVLDMVTDSPSGHTTLPLIGNFDQNLLYHRISTACLLVILSQVYRPGLTFVSLLALDIASHWLQMYSTFLIGKASHKDVKDSTNWLFKAYYGNRTFMAYCCVSCEVLYIILFLLAEKQNENLMDVILHSIQQKSFLSLLVVISLFGWAVKQAVNVIQMKTAADVCVLHDTNKKQKP
uniref:CDP-diacylglycerol--inositol 3-phosphatidyltransferase n=1 Tax=Cucumis melo TaxID=3656 RepID=A0A9I9DNJ1_CUCME